MRIARTRTWPAVLDISSGSTHGHTGWVHLTLSKLRGWDPLVFPEGVSESQAWPSQGSLMGTLPRVPWSTGAQACYSNGFGEH